MYLPVEVSAAGAERARRTVSVDAEERIRLINATEQCERIQLELLAVGRSVGAAYQLDPAQRGGVSAALVVERCGAHGEPDRIVSIDMVIEKSASQLGIYLHLADDWLASQYRRAAEAIDAQLLPGEPFPISNPATLDALLSFVEGEAS